MTVDDLRARWTPERELQERIELMYAMRRAEPIPTRDEEFMARYRQPARTYGPMPRLRPGLLYRVNRWWREFWML